jgi:2-dehydropantoate 2-reductase
MKILNYGAGAVGLGLDSCLLKSGQTLDLVSRKKTADLLNKEGFKRTGIFGDVIAAPGSFRAFSSLKEIPPTDYDLVIVSVKSYDSKDAALDLSQHKNIFSDKTKLVLCQNGWGNAEVFTRYFPKEQLYSARVITGFTRPKPNEVVITVHADDVHIGSLFNSSLDCLAPLAQAISKGGIPCRVVPDIEKDLWAKLIYNCALNPLGATLGVSYGALAEKKETRLIMEEIIKEIFTVMQAAGYKTHWATAQEYTKVFYEKLVPATANHHSSTLQALRLGKRIELEALTGVVLELAKKHNIPVPVNQKIYQEIKQIAEKNKAKA